MGEFDLGEVLLSKKQSNSQSPPIPPNKKKARKTMSGDCFITYMFLPNPLTFNLEQHFIILLGNLSKQVFSERCEW